MIRWEPAACPGASTWAQGAALSASVYCGISKVEVPFIGKCDILLVFTRSAPKSEKEHPFYGTQYVQFFG